MAIYAISMPWNTFVDNPDILKKRVNTTHLVEIVQKIVLSRLTRVLLIFSLRAEQLIFSLLSMTIE